MNREQEIYKLIVEDIFMVIEDNEMDIKIEESDIQSCLSFSPK